MKISLPLAIKLKNMANGTRYPASSLKSIIITKMIEDGLIIVKLIGRSKKELLINNCVEFNNYLKNKFEINNLDNYIELLKKDDIKRSELIEVSSNSKTKNVRSFKGFLVNSFENIEVKLGDENIIIHPQSGLFTYIYDFEKFIPTKNTIIIGIENSENFRYIDLQKQIFPNTKLLFVSRYPQSKDLIKWLQSIPNEYIHFGDFDFSGIYIYLNEYKKHLLNRASFLIPDNIEQLIIKHGTRDLYNKQSHIKLNPKHEGITNLLNLFHKHKKCLEQEILIQKK